MSALKAAWVTPFATSDSLYTLSLESAQADCMHRLNVEESLFPSRPTPEHPLRHVTKLALLDIEDLRLIREAIDRIEGLLEE